MRKSLLTLMLAGGIAASATAADVAFSYAYEPNNSFGSQKKENYDVAIFLPGETFAGYKVKGIKGQLSTSTGYKDGKVWLASDLTLSGKSINPDLGEWNCAVSDNGVDYTLPSAYTIPADGIYVGYSFAIDKLSDTSKYPIMISTTGGNENTFYFHSSKSNPSSWANYGQSEGYAAAIVVTLEVNDMKDNNVTIGNLPSVLMNLNEASVMNAQLLNTASNDVNSIDVEYTLNGTTQTQHFDFAQPILAGIARPFNVAIDIPAQSELIKEYVNLKVTKVNGVANAAENNSGEFYVSVVTEMPVHQALLEEYTCLKCGYCTRGYAALEYIKKNHPDFVAISYHNTMQGADPMAIIPYTNYPVSISGNPSASLDRAYVGDPYYGFDEVPGAATKLPVVGDIEYINSQFTTWGVKASAEISEDNIVSVTSQVYNLGKVTDCKNKIAYILVSDGLTGNSWVQTNYYNSNAQSSGNIDEMNNFCKGGIYGQSSVSGLVFDDVVISDQGYLGVAGSIPTELEPEVYYDNTFTFDVNGNSLVQNPDNLYVVVAVLDETGKNINCTRVHVEQAGGVGSIDTDADAPVEYYNLNGVRVANPEKGIYIKKQGSKTSKVAL